MTFQEFKDEIITGLGGNLVDIELEDADVSLAFKRAVRTFKQKGHNTYRREFMAVSVEPDITSYDIPHNIEDGVRVMRPSGSGLFGGEDLFVKQAIDELLPSGSISDCNGIAMLQYELAQNKLAQYEKMMAVGVDFQIDKFKHQVKFFTTPRVAEVWFVEVYANLEDEEYMEMDWIQRWTSAEAKIILGQAYRKFSSLAAPHGEIQLSGSEMVSEGKEEQRLLLEDIDNMVDGNIDYWGVYIV